MAFSPAFLEELRRRLSIFDLVGRKVRLTRRGKQATGLCPFHNEKSPSFHVYDDDEPHYHCFGCGAHGDAITFVMQTDGLVPGRHSACRVPFLYFPKRRLTWCVSWLFPCF